MLARSHRQAGSACVALAKSAGSANDRAHWQSEAVGWLQLSLARFRAMAQAGVLQGEELTAPAQIRQQLATLERYPASSR